MYIYNYDPYTLEYESTGLADPSPLEPGIYLVPAFATELPVPEVPNGQKAYFINGTWELDDIVVVEPVPPTPPTLDELILSKSNELNLACQNAIYQGFISSALGSPYTYPAKDKDQTNLIASVTSSLYPSLASDWVTPFWCEDSLGTWAYRLHNASQIQQAGADGKAAILECLSKNAGLQYQAMTATSADQLALIIWN